MINFKKVSKETGIDERTLKGLYKEAEDVTKSVFGNTKNKDYVEDTFMDLVKKYRYNESVKIVDPISNYLENKDVSVEQLLNEKYKQRKSVEGVQIDYLDKDDFGGERVFNFQLNGDHKTGLSWDEIDFSYSDQGKLYKFGQDVKNPEMDVVVELLKKAYPKMVK